jgi:hypothetical protein
MLQPRERGMPELPPSLVESSRMACSDDNPLRTMPMSTVCELFPSVDRLRLSKQSAMNSRFLEPMVLAQESSMPNKLMLLVTTVGLGKLNHWNVQRKACCKSLFLACQLLVFSAPVNNRVVRIACFLFCGGLINN